MPESHLLGPDSLTLVQGSQFTAQSSQFMICNQYTQVIRSIIQLEKRINFQEGKCLSGSENRL